MSPSQDGGSTPPASTIPPPGAEGNDRMGRLWQTLILARGNPGFAITPAGSMAHARQREYYEAIGRGTKSDRLRVTPFVILG